ncbi:MAG: MmcQ/YjbR family DNA-binding protein [Chitinophagales bacterium]
MDIEILRSICLKQEGATEDIKWGNDLCFCIAEKMFCVAGLQPPLQISFKVKDDEFDELINKQGIIPAPYVARYKWVLAQDVNLFTKKQWEHYIRQSYELVKSKLSKKQLNKFNP